MKQSTQRPRDFFYEHAGYSVKQGETREQGRRRCARELERAERDGSDAGLSFEWKVDRDMDSSDWTDETPAWATWNCCCRDANGEIVASLCGIDFGRDGEPWGNPYRRVVEAELASEGLHNATAPPTATANDGHESEVA
jgi:hypothetical protein